MALHRKGRFRNAGKIYDSILKQAPDHADALHLSGLIAMERQNASEALNLIRSAIRHNPEPALYYRSLAKAHAAMGQVEEAIRCYRKSLELEPDSIEAHQRLGHLLHRKGDLPGAHACYRNGVERHPDDLILWINLGSVCNEMEKSDEAVACFQRSIRISPRFAQAHYNLALAYERKGERRLARQAYETAISHDPKLLMAHNNLGNLLRGMGRIEEAISAYHRALEIDPGQALLYNNLTNAYQDAGQLARALDAGLKAIRLKPDFGPAYNNVANIYKEQGRIGEAVSSLKTARELCPRDARIGSNFLMTLHYDPAASPETLFEEHRQWAGRCAAHIPPMPLDPGARLSGERLRVGYASPDFRGHSVAFFIESILAHHDRSRFETFAYANVRRPDQVTARLRRKVEHWRDIAGMSPGLAARRVRRDRIHILVDLAGHTADGCLLVFAHKPAPVQITWIGYPDTTGLPAMDYRLTDAAADPPGETDHLASEVLVRLPNCFLCYRPHDDSPDVNRPPADRNGAITFGSFNNSVKINHPLLAAWAGLLTALPEARLSIQWKSFSERENYRSIEEQLVRHGVRPDQLRFHGRVASPLDHLALYHQVDIALDPFPYNGTTTTCEALWMGVPVIALAGGTHVGRVGASILTHVGLPELIARTPAEYVDLAARLARDLQRLRSYRECLRSKMKKSPLMDPEGFTRSLEAVYTRLWNQKQS